MTWILLQIHAIYVFQTFEKRALYYFNALFPSDNLILPAFGRTLLTEIKVSCYFFAGEEYLAFKPSRISLVMLYTLSAYNRLSNPVLLIIML